MPTLFDLLAYDAMDPGMDVGLLYSQLMEDDGLCLEPGYYVMSSGPRRADGSVLNHIVFFTIEEGKTTEIELVMRSDVSSLIGERIVAYLDGGSEPTTHAMQDISILKDRFNNLGGNMTFFFQNEDDLKNFKLKNFNDLPQNIVFEINQDIPTTNLPIFLIFNEKDEVIFESKGYTIGLGEQLLRHFSE